MKLVCSQVELSNALSNACRAVSSRPSHPVLANVLLTADANLGQLRITGYDLSLGIQATIPASIEESGTITVPARLFGDIISRLSHDSPISLSCIEEEVEITSLSGSFSMKGITSEDYPDLPLNQNIDSVIELDPVELLQGIKATLFAASTDESKQLLTGVYINANGHALEFAATDGHRLAIMHLPEEDGVTNIPMAIIVPGKSLRELERLLVSCKESVHLFCEKNQLVINCQNQILTTRTLDGTFPAYRSLIPPTFSTEVTLHRKSLIASLERIGVLAEQHNNVAKISFDLDEGIARITVDAQDIGRGSEQIAATINGKPIDIAFNVRYLIDGLKTITGENVIMKCNQPTTPAVIYPTNEEDDYTYLVMPVQIRA